MATFHFDLVSPEKLVFSGEVDQVDVPGVDGDFGVLAAHAPLVALIKPGVLTVHAGGQKQQIIVTGGFAEVSDKGLTILADIAESAEEFDRAVLKKEIKETEKRAKEMQGSALDRELERLDHFRELDTRLQGTAMH
jgi:F-type H+-transporting ATPase subunit epsilon